MFDGHHRRLNDKSLNSPGRFTGPRNAFHTLECSQSPDIE